MKSVICQWYQDAESLLRHLRDMRLIGSQSFTNTVNACGETDDDSIWHEKINELMRKRESIADQLESARSRIDERVAKLNKIVSGPLHSRWTLAYGQLGTIEIDGLDSGKWSAAPLASMAYRTRDWSREIERLWDQKVFNSEHARQVWELQQRCPATDKRISLLQNRFIKEKGQLLRDLAIDPTNEPGKGGTAPATGKGRGRRPYAQPDDAKACEDILGNARGEIGKNRITNIELGEHAIDRKLPDLITEGIDDISKSTGLIGERIKRAAKSPKN